MKIHKKPTYIGTGQTLTDLERNNRITEESNKIMKMFAAILIIWTVIAIWVIWKVISSGAVNHYIAKCVS